MGIVLASVEVRNNDISKALKLFKKKEENSGHIQELKDRRYFIKPSMVKRIQKNKIEFKRKVDKILEKERMIQLRSRML